MYCYPYSRGVIIPGGFGSRGIEGKVAAAQFCRERNVPMLGVCLGLQVAVIEFARNVLGWKGEAHTPTHQPTMPGMHLGMAAFIILCFIPQIQ